jgi:hypothetical protein
MDEEIDYRRAFAEAQAEARQRVLNLVPAIPIRPSDPSGTSYNEWGAAPTNLGGDGGTSTAIEKHPFQIKISNGRIVVAPGTVNQLLPQGYVGDLPAPSGASSVVVVALKCTTNGATVNLVEYVGLASAPTAPAATLGAAPAEFYVVLGVVVGASVQQVVKNNILAKVTIARQVEKATIPVGASPWNNFYSWLVIETNQFFAQ